MTRVDVIVVKDEACCAKTPDVCRSHLNLLIWDWVVYLLRIGSMSVMASLNLPIHRGRLTKCWWGHPVLPNVGSTLPHHFPLLAQTVLIIYRYLLSGGMFLGSGEFVCGLCGIRKNKDVELMDHYRVAHPVFPPPFGKELPEKPAEKEAPRGNRRKQNLTKFKVNPQQHKISDSQIISV
jgi:hypothetical protein